MVLDASAEGMRLRHVGHALEAVLPAPLPEDFATLWLAADRGLIEATTLAVLERGAPALARGLATCGAQIRVEFEMVIAPLDFDGPQKSAPRTRRRLLCLLQTLGAEVFLRGRPVTGLSLSAVFPPPLPQSAPRLRLVARRE
jgi:hypothetical protein